VSENQYENDLGSNDSGNLGCFPVDDTSRHKYRSVFVIYWMPR